MATANFWQRGEALDYTNNGDELIPAGTVIALEDRIGVAGCDIPAGAVGSVHMTGVFEIAKTGTAEIKMGKAVYFDGEGITDAADGGSATESEPADGSGEGEPADDGGESEPAANIPAGYAAEDSAADATTIKVQIGA